jgi:hypothetical protein
VGRYKGASERDAFGEVPVAHFGGIRAEGNVMVKVGNKIVEVDLVRERGVAVLLPKAGEYEVTVNGARFCHKMGAKFSVGQEESFWGEIADCNEQDQKGKRLGTEKIVGIAVGAALFVAAVVVLVVLIGRRRLRGLGLVQSPMKGPDDAPPEFTQADKLTLV